MKTIYAALAIILCGSATAVAQTPAAAPADSALNACAAAADRKDEATARQFADRAEAGFDAMIADGARAADGYAGKARVISQCRVPFAPLMRKIPLIDDGNKLLERALALDSTHFAARMTLAMNHYHVPEMFGRTDAAIVQLEKLTELARGRAIPPLATVYLYLGDAYLRKGRKDDAVAAWRFGQEMFPTRKTEFEERLKKAGAAADVQEEATTAVTAVSPPRKSAPVYDVAPIIVEAGRFSVDDTRGGASLKRMDVVTMPGGTADVLQVFQAMPGVTRASEGSDLYVRGGDAAEAPVFVDGARMTYAGAFEGLHGGIFGVLDPNGIRKADFSSGGFSARYGNALSGILDITSEGRPNERSWRAGVNLVSAGATIRSPLNDKFGLYATGKATETSALLWTQNRGDEYARKPWSVNGMAGLTFNPNHKLEIKTTALTETDDATRVVDVLGYTGELRARGATHMGVIAARAVNDAGDASVRASLSAAKRTTSFEVGVLDRERNDISYTVRLDGDVAPVNRVRVRAGIEGAAYDASEDGRVPSTADLAPGSPARAIDNEHEAMHVGGYTEAEINATGKLAFITGLRADKLPGSDGITLDPRIAVAYRTNGWTLRTAAGVFQQGSWRVGYRTPSPGSPSGVATRARHVVVGFEREDPVLIRVEGFAKSYDGYQAIAGTSAITPDAEGPAIGEGRVLGVDALVRWKASGAVSGWASYSLLDARVRLQETGAWVAASTDVRHTLTSVVKFAFGEDWEVGTTTRLGSGRPYTPIVGSNSVNGVREAVYGAVHSERLPVYARFDTRLTRLLPTSKGTYVFYIEGLNLLDRANVMAYTYDATYSRRIPIESFFANRTLVFGAEAMF
ncbi:MAG TPA: TonB-dependent receptor [Longimicrobiales bacterium]